MALGLSIHPQFNAKFTMGRAMIDNDLIVITDSGAMYYEDATQYIRAITPKDVFQIKSCDHTNIKRPFTHLDNQKFLQQKMQGKRRVY